MLANRARMALLCLISIQCMAFDVASAIKVGTASFKEGSEDTRDFLAIPPFLKQASGKPSVILAFDTSGSMLNAAYESKALRHVATGFDGKVDEKVEGGEEGGDYHGYFDPALQYRYNLSLGLFFEDASLNQGDNLAWDGGFLNWLTMRRIDVARKAMVGGKVRQRKGEWINGSKMWVLEGEVEFNPNDTLTFQDPESARYSPISNHAIITVEKGRISVATEDITPQLASLEGLNIKLAVREEPTGFIQTNQSRVNFGLSVYNFDHKLNTATEIINDNRVDGQTMHPCYPLFDAERLMKHRSKDASDSNMEIKRVILYNSTMRDYLCVPTGVHAPNDQIVQVIEEYPLIWGTTPIAEGVVDIGNYIRQAPPQYSSGNDPYGVYGVDGGYQDNGFRWDPYYDAAQGAVLSCKKVFILHFSDGVSNADYDARNGQANHLKSSPYYQEIPGDLHTGTNESLDSVALALRKNDCRSNDLEGVQNIVSYYVFAALGDEGSNPDALRRMMEAAARGGFIDGSINGSFDVSLDDKGTSNGTVGLPDPMWPIDISGRQYTNFYTYSLLDQSECPSSEWDGDGDCIPDTFYLVKDVDDIVLSLQNVLSDMLSRSSQGTAASVISASSSAEGVVYQASFSPSATIGHDTVKWFGDVSALMIDQQGRLRSDDGDGRLESTIVDPIYSSCYDVLNDTVRVKFSTDEASSSTSPIGGKCTDAGGFSSTLNDVGYLWRAGSVLSSLSDTEAATQRATYESASKNRYISTNISPVTTREGATSVVEKDFVPSTFTENLVGLLNTATVSEASSVVNYIRGVDQPGMRSRQLNSATQRLGDIINSSPTAVGAPSENLHLINGDASYWDFYMRYKDRRIITYVGGNDGMLHAFNGGWYNKKNRQFSAVKAGYTAWTLGQETWAFVPYNLLPHLSYLTKPEYGLKGGNHAYFVDQTPYVFDAQIFGKDGVVGQADRSNESSNDSTNESETIHPHGWGTVLVVGFGRGGGKSDVYPDPSDTSSSVAVRPAYLIFDITDPEQPPKLLAEFTHEKLGASMSTPTALTVKGENGTDWYLAFGSGPSPNANGHRQVVSEQNAHLFMLNLKNMHLENGFGTAGVMDLGESKAFVGDIVAVDIDMDATTDTAYFGTVAAVNDNASGEVSVTDSVEMWGGKLFRLRIKAGSAAGNHQWKADLMFNARAPISTRPNISFDKNKNRWIHFGTGRFYTEDDLQSDAPNLIVGLKEPRNAQGIFAMDTYRSTPAVIRSKALVDVTNASITESSGQLNYSISLSPALEADTVEALEARQLQYTKPSSYLSGWKTTLQEGERAMGVGSIFGGVFNQTTYKPEQALCSVFGESYLYALRYTTGTAWYKHIFEDPDFGSNNDAVIEKVQLGITPSLSPSIHLGESRVDGEATIINLNSDQSISINIEHNLEDIMSKEVGWRQL